MERSAFVYQYCVLTDTRLVKPMDREGSFSCHYRWDTAPPTPMSSLVHKNCRIYARDIEDGGTLLLYCLPFCSRLCVYQRRTKKLDWLISVFTVSTRDRNEKFGENDHWTKGRLYIDVIKADASTPIFLWTRKETYFTTSNGRFILSLP